MRTLLIIILITLSCAAQKKIETAKDESKVCWASQEDEFPGIQYEVVYRKYQTVDTVWKHLSDATTNVKIIKRPGLGKYELGVRSIYGVDTSEVRSSLSDSACVESDGCNTPCKVSGPWYVWWRISGPKFIRIE